MKPLPNIKVRGTGGEVVELTALEFERMFRDGGKCERPQVRHRKCTFLPGVSAKYDAWVASYPGKVPAVRRVIESE